MLRAIIVDNPRPADDSLRFLLSSHNRVELVAEPTSLSAAVEAAQDVDAHVAFVEWRVGDELGVSLVERFRQADVRTQIVLATAFCGGALRAFEAGVLDYVTRPVQLGRLEQAIARVAGVVQPAPSFSRIAVKRRGQYVVVDLAEVNYFEAQDRFVYAHTATDRWELDVSLSYLEQRLPPEQFFRCHRRALVRLASIDRVVAISRGRYCAALTTPDAASVPVARKRLSTLLARLAGN